MRYQGGKVRIGKAVAATLKKQEAKYAKELGLTTPLPYFEPFGGMLGVMRYMGEEGEARKRDTRAHVRKRVASDVNQDVVEMWRRAQKGWKPPKKCSEKEWERLRRSALTARAPSAARGFVGSQVSFGGAFFSGYAGRYDPSKDFCAQGARGLAKILPEVQDVKMYALPYEEFHPKGYLIYADPPYDTHYASFGRNKYMSRFDSAKFWRTMEEWSKDNLVFVSEFKAPRGWKTIWKQQVNRAINPRQRKDYGYGTHKSVERLYFYAPPKKSSFAKPTLGLKRSKLPFRTIVPKLHVNQGRKWAPKGQATARASQKKSPQAKRRIRTTHKSSPKARRRNRK